ncbi:hypothetical protein JZ751_008274 [Albula glossodonta]|uniref:Leukocyte receptor cluster member 4 n=1 Tax=Albula glossodonta TaxID=121402 RepID=A0A8T2N9E3_9TELE|nr:hypothetical protein JZ751_008274 [Albula glossodonta]
MTTDLEANLSVCLDLSSVIEEAVRSAVCSVLEQIQRLIGKDVAELRAAVARKDCENEKLRAQLELARRELLERTNEKKRPVLNDNSPRCDELEGGNTVSVYGVHNNTYEDPNASASDHSPSLWNQPWDSDSGSTIQQNFIDPLESTDAKRDFTTDVDYTLDAAESDTDPNPTSEPLEMIPKLEAMKTDPNPPHRKSKASGLDAHTARELRVVQVKEELPAGLSSSSGPELSQSTKPKPYICGECGKSYLWLKSLKKHQKIHSAMSEEELIYLAILAGTIPVGFLFRYLSPPVKQGAALLLGLSISLATCRIHTLHSLITVLGTWAIIKFSWRSAPSLSLGWTFLYLLFFRLATLFGLPPPTPFANAMVSLANEVQTYHLMKKEDVSSFSKSSVIGGLSQEPSLYDIISYSYCYIGLMTGPFFRYQTYVDWLQQPKPSSLPGHVPCLHRLKLVPVYGALFLYINSYFPLAYVRTEEFLDHQFFFRQVVL